MILSILRDYGSWQTFWFGMGEYGRMNKILKELYESCQRADEKKETQLLDVYAIEIQLYTKTKKNKTLKV
ncbi:hypothetical protein L1987_19348 [Smallanthus sonchifolius]|uniref:Uncharacterized protein n=1 Tax=Smallanthus sonchifolius TaxID=185202 RepID=A0ACB9IQE1_9ASTR|nr:hypothetical protein L1987_19348 [Smallanthus sonchifolius]